MYDSADSGAACGRRRRQLCAGFAIALLGACGGGGGGTPPPPSPPANQAPVFTSGTSVAVAENVGGSVYQAAATDPEGAAVAFSIAGGADAARFSIAPNGALAFVAPPNFDLPADSDLNNTYLVEIAASDGQNLVKQTVAVTVSNSKEGVSVRRIATGFVNPVSISARGETSLLVAEKGGAIYALDLQSGTRQLLAQVPFVNGQGVLSITANEAAGPDRSFYVMYTSNGFVIIDEYTRLGSLGPYGVNVFGRVAVIPAPGYAGGGWLGFDSQNRLLIATGDAGGSGDPTGSAQSDSSRLGKLIRVAPNPTPLAGGTLNYFILTNLATGLHQPAGGFFYSGGLLIGDRGETVADEVNFFATGSNGINFGWPFKEGFQIVRGTPPADVVDPVTEYPRSSAAAADQGNVGGAIAGNAVASIAGHYVFADRSGAIFSFPAASLQNARTATERRTADFVPDIGTIDRPVGVVADSNGRLYIVDTDGEIFRVDAG